jgi:hypothetical protein
LARATRAYAASARDRTLVPLRLLASNHDGSDRWCQLSLLNRRGSLHRVLLLNLAPVYFHLLVTNGELRARSPDKSVIDRFWRLVDDITRPHLFLPKLATRLHLLLSQCNLVLVKVALQILIADEFPFTDRMLSICFLGP